MRYLLDTRVWLWLQASPTEIRQEALDVLLDTRNVLFLSAVSCWEIAVKYAAGKLPLPAPPVRVRHRCRPEAASKHTTASLSWKNTYCPLLASDRGITVPGSVCHWRRPVSASSAIRAPGPASWRVRLLFPAGTLGLGVDVRMHNTSKPLSKTISSVRSVSA